MNNLYVTKITAGIVVLEGGLDSLHDQLKEIHQNVNEKIRSRFSDYFDDLVNLKDVTCDLEAITSTEEIPLSPNAVGTSSPIDSLENGFRIVLKEIPSIEVCVGIMLHDLKVIFEVDIV